MVAASPRIQQYFDKIEGKVKDAFARASKARKRGLDPDPVVDIKLAKNMAERVVGLISVLAPQIAGSGVVARIIELEEQYGLQDWRVALKIAEEIAKQKFCKFEEELEAIDIGIRTGFAYVTVGVVSSPLDGIVSITLKDRRDGEGKYLCLSYAGPVRNAGGTAAAVSVIIADYVRTCLGYAAYDASEDETKRATVELQDYHDRVTNLQYHPSEEELNFLMPRLPVEVSGEPSERFEVSMCKDLPRINTNVIRSGYCLVLSSCIPLKARKLWKKLSKWGNDMNLSQWNFLEEFLAIQKKAKAGGKKATDAQKQSKLTPDYTYIKDLVAGRPILGHPLEPGGFRLRYGRGRASGLSGQSIHPATMHVLEDYIAVGTQLKVGRPGKGATYTPCDTVEGPVVRLESGDVLYLDDEAKAKQVKKQVVEILFLGDVLIDVGDFINRAHPLIPVGYCEEWWAREVEKALQEKGLTDPQQIASTCHLQIGQLDTFVREPLTQKPSFNEAILISTHLEVSLHPKFQYHWMGVSQEQGLALVEALSKAKIHHDAGALVKVVVPHDAIAKRAFEVAGVPHLFVNNEYLVLEGPVAQAIAYAFDIDTVVNAGFLNALKARLTEIPLFDALVGAGKKLRDKSGTSIAARMGRPEKAKMRKLTGSPHGLFAVGDEGGRLRSLQSALSIGKVTADFPLFRCNECKEENIFPICAHCLKPAEQLFYSRGRKRFVTKEELGEEYPLAYSKRTISISNLLKQSQKLIGETYIPELVKGVRGTSNAEHIQEHLAKALLRAKHNVYVNKDGTIRFDASELTYTHFKPHEISTSVERLKELGYTHDIHGKPLVQDDQVLEILPQDAALPACPVGPNEPSDKVIIRVTKFIDDLLTKAYKEESYFNARKREDLIGHLIVALAPHTSAGLVVRIIGFTKTQGFLAHPYVHQACRRDCDGDEIGFMLLMDAFLNFSKRYLPRSRGGTMDAPLVLTSVLNPAEVDDQAFDVGIESQYPLELYEAAQEFKKPWDVKLKTINNVLNTPDQFEGMGFTHGTADVNAGVLCSAYKTLPSMAEKLAGQMSLARKIRAVFTADVAERVIQKHFLKDTKGNLRKFSQQQFRCVACNEKYRRPPLCGHCTRCKKGKIIFTISQGSVLKYLEASLNLTEEYDVSPYLKQTMAILQRVTESVFGREKEKQTGLKTWF